MYLKETATPISNTGRREFVQNLSDDDTYLDEYPRDWFRIEGDDVMLRGDIASRLQWNCEEEISGWLNINAIAQSVTVAGETYSIYPGFWCSSVPSDQRVEANN
jgi:hypothetical protein